MGKVFSKNGTDGQKLTLERRNVQRVVFVPLFLAAVASAGVVFMHKSELYGESLSLSVAMTLYAVISVAFSCFAVQLLKRKSKRSELWLFQMIYMIANTGFLTYISYGIWEKTGSLFVYALAVLAGACILYYGKGEYAVCAGIESLFPVTLYMNGMFLPHHFVAVAAVHLLAGIVALQLYAVGKTAEEYRRKYIQEIKTAERDPLTKVNNRRGMMRKVMSVWPKLEQEKRPVAVMVIDIDYFKKYNDRFGHPAGDACLCCVADTLKKTVQGLPGLVSRIGGEEFLVFVYGLNDDAVYGLAEQIRKNIEGMGIPHSEEAKFRYVTVSIGVATDRCSKEISFGGLYRRGDKELYRAKNTGRNCVGFRGRVFSTQRERMVNIR